jgi:hypothetical protein
LRQLEAECAPTTLSSMHASMRDAEILLRQVPVYVDRVVESDRVVTTVKEVPVDRIVMTERAVPVQKVVEVEKIVEVG